MSAPAQKAGGVPVTTTARTASSVSHRVYASPSSAPIRPLNALRTSGRSSVIVATPTSSTSKRMCS